MVLENPLKSSLHTKEINQSVLTEINPDYSLEGLMLKLKLHGFGHWMQRVDALEKTLLVGIIEGRRRRGQQRMRCLEMPETQVLSLLLEDPTCRGAIKPMCQNY